MWTALHHGLLKRQTIRVWLGVHVYSHWFGLDPCTVTSVMCKFSANVHSPGGFPKNQPHGISPEPEPHLTGDFVSSHIWYHLTPAFKPPLPIFLSSSFFFLSTPAGVDNCSLRESFQILECKVIPELRIPRLLTKTRGTISVGSFQDSHASCAWPAASIRLSFDQLVSFLLMITGLSYFWPPSMGISRQ